MLDHKDRNRDHRLVRQVDGLVADRAFRKRLRRCDEAMVPGSRELGRAAPRKQVKSIRPGEGRRLVTSGEKPRWKMRALNWKFLCSEKALHSGSGGGAR